MKRAELPIVRRTGKLKLMCMTYSADNPSISYTRVSCSIKLTVAGQVSLSRQRGLLGWQLFLHGVFATRWMSSFCLSYSRIAETLSLHSWMIATTTLVDLKTNNKRIMNRECQQEMLASSSKLLALADKVSWHFVGYSLVYRSATNGRGGILPQKMSINWIWARAVGLRRFAGPTLTTRAMQRADHWW